VLRALKKDGLVQLELARAAILDQDWLNAQYMLGEARRNDAPENLTTTLTFQGFPRPTQRGTTFLPHSPTRLNHAATPGKLLRDAPDSATVAAANVSDQVIGTTP